MIRFTLAILFSFLSHFVLSQKQSYFVYYGVEISQVQTGSGHGSGYVFNTHLRQGCKSLGFGLVYQGQDNRVSGANAEYKIFLGRNVSPEAHKNRALIKMKPYVHYNCIYHNSKVNAPDFIPPGSKKSGYLELPSSPGTIASMEHFIGPGLQIYFSKSLCLDASAGFGTYIGSLDHFTPPGTIGIHKENYGFTFSLEFGLGYSFGV